MLTEWSGVVGPWFYLESIRNLLFATKRVRLARFASPSTYPGLCKDARPWV